MSVPVCLSAKISLKNATSRVAKAFKDVLLNEKKSAELHWNVSVPDTSQGGSFHCYFS